jgi:hypothetical protein
MTRQELRNEPRPDTPGLGGRTIGSRWRPPTANSPNWGAAATATKWSPNELLR